MYYNIDWHIKIGNFKLMYVDSVEIHKSVDQLSDTATVVIPAQNLNKSLEAEKKIKRGDTITINAGYDGEMVSEFVGYVESISTDGGSITLKCEDEVWKTRVPVKDKELKKCSSKDVAAYLVSEINSSAGTSISLACDYQLSYDKFVINKATAFDVLKKLQDESKGNIYMKGNILHFHPAYIEKFGDAAFDFAINIEESDLVYKIADQRKFEVEVEGQSNDGKRVVVTVGTTGGDKITEKRNGISDPATLRKIGEEILKYKSFDGYEGSITTWHKPYVEPGYSAKITDKDYEYKDGTYYVTAVTTTISESGIVRKVQLGRRLV